MSTTFTGTLGVSLTGNVVDAGTLTTITDNLTVGSGSFPAISRSLANGTGANQASDQFYEQRTINSGVNYDYDLTALTDRRGQALSLSKVKWIIIVLDAPTTGVKLVFKGSTATNPIGLWKESATADDDIPDLCVMCCGVDGWTVDGTHKTLRLYASGGNITYRIYIAGN